MEQYNKVGKAGLHLIAPDCARLRPIAPDCNMSARECS